MYIDRNDFSQELTYEVIIFFVLKSKLDVQNEVVNLVIMIFI